MYTIKQRIKDNGKLKVLLIIFTFHFSLFTSAQTVGNMSQSDYDVISQMSIGTGNGSTSIKRTNRAAVLELGDSLNSRRALLLPRGNRDSVANAIEGLLFYDRFTKTFIGHNDTGWVDFGSGGGGNLQATLDLGNTADKSILLTAAGSGDIGIQAINGDGSGVILGSLDDVGYISLSTPTSAGLIYAPVSGSRTYQLPSASGTIALTSDLTGRFGVSGEDATATQNREFNLNGGGRYWQIKTTAADNYFGLFDNSSGTYLSSEYTFTNASNGRYSFGNVVPGDNQQYVSGSFGSVNYEMNAAGVTPYFEAVVTGTGTNVFRMKDSTSFLPSLGKINIDSLRDGASYNINKLIGWGSGNGVVGYITPASPITLTSGVLGADTSILATRLRVQKGIDSVAALISGGTSTLQQVTDAGKITTNDITAAYFSGDSTRYNTILLPDHAVDTLYILTSSIEAGSNASVADSAYPERLATYYGLTLANGAASGKGSFYAAQNHNQNVQPGHNKLSIVQLAFNDLRAGGYWTTGSFRTYRKIMNSMKDIFSNQFLKSYVTAGGASVTRYGAWSVLNFSSAGAKTTNGAYTTTVNDSITYVFTDSTVIIQYITADGIAQNYGAFDVYIDNVLQGSYSQNDQTDGFTDGAYNNQNNPGALIFTGLTLASHKIKLVKTDANARPFAVDIFGHLVDATQGKQLIFVKPFKLNATGYSVVAANGSALYTSAISDAVGASMDSLKLTLPAAYQPFVKIVSADSYFIPATDLSADSLHPNNQGHRHIAEAIEAAALSSSLPSLSDGTIVFNGDGYYGSIDGETKRFSMIDEDSVVYIQRTQTIVGQKTFSKPITINVGELADGIVINNTTSQLGTMNYNLSGTNFMSVGVAGASSPFFANENFIISNQGRDLNFYGNTTLNFSMTNAGHFTMKDVTAPSTPASGYGSLYVNSDSLRFKNDAGTVFTLGLGGSGGYTTLAQFVTETNWTTGYINGSGDYTALALGSSGKVLTSNGASSAPTWETPTTGYTTLSQFVGETNWQVFYSNGSGDVTGLTVGAANTVLLGNGVTSAPTWGTVPNAALTNSTISGIALGGTLANLTATDATLTFSGTYNGGTARTIGINLSNANTWLADISVPDEAYDATAWNGSVEVPTKNAIRDKIETLGGGYTTLAQFVGENNWKTYYSNGSGDISELAIGSTGKVLTSNGTTSAPSWETASAAWNGTFLLTQSGDQNSTTLSASSQLYFHTGSTASSTLPLLSGSSGKSFHLVNQGSGNWTLNRNTSDQIWYHGAAVNSFILKPGMSATIVYFSASFWVTYFDGYNPDDQPIDADLTSWAAITRASGIDTWIATPSSANLRSALTDEIGTGAALFNNTTSLIITNTAVTASGNAATVAVTASLTTVTNNSAATLTITMTTASAVDGQISTVRILDFSGVAQTIAWVNTENSSIAAPTTSNGSTTLFLTVKFIYNSATSKWRCIGYA